MDALSSARAGQLDLAGRQSLTVAKLTFGSTETNPLRKLEINIKRSPREQASGGLKYFHVSPPSTCRQFARTPSQSTSAEVARNGPCPPGSIDARRVPTQLLRVSPAEPFLTLIPLPQRLRRFALQIKATERTTSPHHPEQKGLFPVGMARAFLRARDEHLPWGVKHEVA